MYYHITLLVVGTQNRQDVPYQLDKPRRTIESKSELSSGCLLVVLSLDILGYQPISSNVCIPKSEKDWSR